LLDDVRGEGPLDEGARPDESRARSAGKLDGGS
jgi:hypothetical protein